MAGRIASGKPPAGAAVPAAADAGTRRAEHHNRATDTARALRSGLRAARAAMTPEARAAADRQIHAELEQWLARWVQARQTQGHHRHVVAAFWPIGAEPDLRPLLSAWAALTSIVIALPVVEQRAAPLAFHAWTPTTPMRVGDYGIPEPDATPAIVPDAVLVPLLGFTDDADRIGYGGGFYDRTLAGLQAAGVDFVSIGVAYVCSRLPAGAHTPEPHDVRLDAVLHEEGWTPAPC